MNLLHFSEDPTMATFVPRPPLAHPEQSPRVWAVDAKHAPLYRAVVASTLDYTIIRVRNARAEQGGATG